MTSPRVPLLPYEDYQEAKRDLLAAHFAHHASRCPDCGWPRLTDYEHHCINQRKEG